MYAELIPTCRAYSRHRAHEPHRICTWHGCIDPYTICDRFDDGRKRLTSLRTIPSRSSSPSGAVRTRTGTLSPRRQPSAAPARRPSRRRWPARRRRAAAKAPRDHIADVVAAQAQGLKRADATSPAPTRCSPPPTTRLAARTTTTKTNSRTTRQGPARAEVWSRPTPAAALGTQLDTAEADAEPKLRRSRCRQRCRQSGERDGRRRQGAERREAALDRCRSSAARRRSYTCGAARVSRGATGLGLRCGD